MVLPRPSHCEAPVAFWTAVDMQYGCLYRPEWGGHKLLILEGQIQLVGTLQHFLSFNGFWWQLYPEQNGIELYCRNQRPGTMKLFDVIT